MARSRLTARLLIAGVAAAIAGPALAQSCIQPSENAAFNVRALQSQLMVAALSCQRDTEYNAFVRKFQRELGTSYSTITAHFRRTAGGGSQRALDGFITQLANEQSQDGIRQGSTFCTNVTPLFQVALSQSNAEALSGLSMERNVLNPMAAPACAERATPATTPSRQRRPAASNRSAATSAR